MLSKHSSLQMYLTAISKAAAPRLELDMNTDLKHYLFREHFQLSRPDRSSKEQNKSQNRKRLLESNRQKGENNLHLTLSMWFHTASFLLNARSASLLQLPLLLHFGNAQSGSRALVTQLYNLEQWARFCIWQTYLLH